MEKDNSALMTFIIDKDRNTRLFYFKVFDKKDDVPTIISGDYLYAYELSNNIVFSFGEARNIKSLTSYATGRVAILGPIRDVETVFRKIEFISQDWKIGEHTYKFESLEELIGNPFSDDIPGLFQIEQMIYKDGFKGKDHILHSFDKGNIVRDLIIPDKCGRVNLVIFETENGVRTGDEMTVTV